MGLGHNNWIKDNGDVTSRTSTRDATSINEPITNPDNVKGSRDDRPLPLPGARVTHWFRLSDNDPFVIDNTPIDSSTYSRNLFQFPTGSNWSASANINVSTLLGAGKSQSVMASAPGSNSDYLGLVADDVNTVKFAAAGVDNAPGNTGDDYTIELFLEETCAIPDILVRKVNLPDGEYGNCLSELGIIPPTTNHFEMLPDIVFGALVITIDSVPPQYETRRYIVAIAGFEAGDFSEWDDVVQ